MVRTARVRTLADNAATSIVTLNNGKFALPERGHLTHVSGFIASAAQGPVRISLLFEPGNEINERQGLKSGWSRGDTTYGGREPIVWDGDIELGPNDHILFEVRNDTEATIDWMGTWVTHV